MSILQEKTWNSVAYEISFNLEIDDQEIEKNINNNCSVFRLWLWLW